MSHPIAWTYRLAIATTTVTSAVLGASWLAAGTAYALECPGMINYFVTPAGECVNLDEPHYRTPAVGSGSSLQGTSYPASGERVAANHPFPPYLITANFDDDRAFRTQYVPTEFGEYIYSEAYENRFAMVSIGDDEAVMKVYVDCQSAWGMVKFIDRATGAMENYFSPPEETLADAEDIRELCQSVSVTPQF